MKLALALYFFACALACLTIGGLAGATWMASESPVKHSITLVSPTPWPFPVAMRICKQQDEQAWAEIEPYIGKPRLAYGH